MNRTGLTSDSKDKSKMEMYWTIDDFVQVISDTRTKYTVYVKCPWRSSLVLWFRIVNFVANRGLKIIVSRSHLLRCLSYFYLMSNSQLSGKYLRFVSFLVKRSCSSPTRKSKLRLIKTKKLTPNLANCCLSVSITLQLFFVKEEFLG